MMKIARKVISSEDLFAHLSPASTIFNLPALIHPLLIYPTPRLIARTSSAKLPALDFMIKTLFLFPPCSFENLDEKDKSIFLPSGE
jgi:hypothetical protein